VGRMRYHFEIVSGLTAESAIQRLRDKAPAAVAGSLFPREPPIAPSPLNHGRLLGHVLRRSTCFGSCFWVLLRSLSG